MQSNHPRDLQCEVAIVGGGLSGLTAAFILNKAGVDVHVLEAAAKLGGRIDSVRDHKTGATLADLGPTWVWPPYQPLVIQWLDQLNIETYPQYEAGDAIVEMHPNGAPSRQPLPGQHGMARLKGGPQTLIDALAKGLPVDRIQQNFLAVRIRDYGERLEISPADQSQPTVSAKHVIIAAPLRLMDQNIDWTGLLDEEAHQMMMDTPTWMAAQAKISIVYDHAFWRDQGLSGRVASRLGPMVEIHDHSGPQGEPAALFGFVGWPAGQRPEKELRQAVTEQLVRTFGPQAADFQSLTIRDWADDPFICSDRDRRMPPAHPSGLPEIIRQSHGNNRVWFAVSETATQSPGLIEGALEAGSRTARHLLSKMAIAR